MHTSEPSVGRSIDPREYCHEQLGDRFAEALSDYDTARRLEVLIDSFLGDFDLTGKSILDVGCGLGFFSERLMQRGAEVTACDLGEQLVRATTERAKCEGCVADALQLVDTFAAERFDIVLSSECIEHTPSPSTALEQMAKVIKPGGFIVVSTPNFVWWPIVKAASVARLRPFNGFENFSSFRSIRRTFEKSGVEVIREEGLHLFPFQLRFHGLSRWCDKRLQVLRSGMINICVLGRKIG